MMILVSRNMVSVSDCNTLTSGARFGIGQSGKRRAKHERKHGHLQNLVLRDRQRNVFRKDIEQHMLPAVMLVRRSGPDDLRGQRQHHTTPACEMLMATAPRIRGQLS